MRYLRLCFAALAALAVAGVLGACTPTPQNSAAVVFSVEDSQGFLKLAPNQPRPGGQCNIVQPNGAPSQDVNGKDPNPCIYFLGSPA